MLGVLIRKELLDNFYSLRFMISSIIVVFIIAVSVFVLRQDYIHQKDAYSASVENGRKLASESENYMELMFMGIKAARPPAKLQFLYTGVEKNPDRRTLIRTFLKPSFTGDLNMNPVFPLFPIIDLMFVVSIVMSLLAFVYTYDAVCGERERGTLKLLMSYSIPRDRVILAKWIGGYISLVIPYVAGVLLCALIILSSRKLGFNGEDWGAFFMTAIISLLFIAVMYSVGLFVSVISRRSSTSISILILIWVIFVLIIPNTAPFIVDQIKPIDSVSKVQAQIQAKTSTQVESLIFKMLDDFEAVLQRHEPGFAWAKFKVDENARRDREEGGGGEQQQQQKEAPQQKAATGNNGAESTSSGAAKPEVSGDVERQAKQAGVDMSSLAAFTGEITDQDLRDIKAFGCTTFINGKLKEKMGMTLDQARQMAQQYGIKSSDIDKILSECEIQKNRYVAELEKQRAAEASASQPTDSGQQQVAASSSKKDDLANIGKKEYTFQDIMQIAPKLTPKDKADTTQAFYGGFLGSAEQSMKESFNIWKQRDVKVASQIRLTKWISRLSPVSSYVYATTDLADTGIEHEIYLRENYLANYQAAFKIYIQSQIGMPYDKMPGKLDPYGIIKQPPEIRNTIDQLSKMEYKPMPLTDRIKIVLPDLFLLFAFAVGFFMAAFFSFIKSEIIE